MVTLTDRPDSTMDVFSDKALCSTDDLHTVILNKRYAKITL